MKALTIWQPYASLIAIGAKRIETRGWPTRYRGPILIHAAKKWDEEREYDCGSIMDTLQQQKEFTPSGVGESIIGHLPWADTLGKILCRAELYDCREMPEPPSDPLEAEFGFYGPGRYGWCLRNIEPILPPIPAVGKRGLWDFEPPVEVNNALRD